MMEHGTTSACSHHQPVSKPKANPTFPALHQPWHFTGSSFTTQFFSLNHQKTHPGKKKKKQTTKFHLGQSELSKGQVSSSMGTQRGCCTQSGEQGRWRNKPPVLTAVYWEWFSHHKGLQFYPVLCGNLLFLFQPVWTQLSVLADRGWLNWNKDFFFFKELQKHFFSFASGHIRTHKRTKQ